MIEVFEKLLSYEPNGSIFPFYNAELVVSACWSRLQKDVKVEELALELGVDKLWIARDFAGRAVDIYPVKF